MSPVAVHGSSEQLGEGQPPGSLRVSERCTSTGEPGGRVHSRTWSTPEVGPSERDVVMLHGLGVASRMCRPAGLRLARTRRVHAPDLVGFGLSPAPSGAIGPEAHAAVIARWMDRVGLVSATVVGTSIGSQVALHLAAARPDLCARLVLASPTVERGRRSWRSQLPRWSKEQRTHSWSFRALMLSDYLRCGPVRPIATFRRFLADEPEELIGDLRMPVLVCRGTRDPLVGREWCAELARRCGGRLRVMPGATHAMCHDSPLELTRVLERFERDTTSGAVHG